MLRSLRALNPGRPDASMLFYLGVRMLLHALLLVVYRLRIFGGANVPAHGPVLVVSNHQSHLDPILAGIAVRPRHLNFLARSTLYAHGAFAWLIRSLNAVPLEQGKPDLAAIRTALAQLEAGRMLLIFPEGTRTGDGKLHPFKKGAWVILARAKCPVLPIAIEGAYATWKRGQGRPALLGRRLMVRVGEPIDPQTLLNMGPEQGLAHLQRTIDTLRGDLAGRIERAGFSTGTGGVSGVEEL